MKFPSLTRIARRAELCVTTRTWFHAVCWAVTDSERRAVGWLANNLTDHELVTDRLETLAFEAAEWSESLELCKIANS